MLQSVFYWPVLSMCGGCIRTLDPSISGLMLYYRVAAMACLKYKTLWSHIASKMERLHMKPVSLLLSVREHESSPKRT
jgi:hypothetical protein